MTHNIFIREKHTKVIQKEGNIYIHAYIKMCQVVVTSTRKKTTSLNAKYTLIIITKFISTSSMTMLLSVRVIKVQPPWIYGI